MQWIDGITPMSKRCYNTKGRDTNVNNHIAKSTEMMTIHYNLIDKNREHDLVNPFVFLYTY